MVNEIFYQQKLAQMLTRKNSIIKVLKEVPFKHKRIDLVEINGSSISCIEVKIKNWQKALDQASINNIFCDKSYIAMPQMFISRVDKKKLKKLSIGLIEIAEDDFSIVLDAKNNQNLIQRYYTEFKKRVETIEKELLY